MTHDIVTIHTSCDREIYRGYVHICCECVCDDRARICEYREGSGANKEYSVLLKRSEQMEQMGQMRLSRPAIRTVDSRCNSSAYNKNLTQTTL